MKEITWKKQKYTLKHGTVIQVNWSPTFSAESGKNWKRAVVQETLSDQFTAVVQVDSEDMAFLVGGPLTFRFYHEIGDSWKPVETDDGQ